jgi:hypothetical protein
MYVPVGVMFQYKVVCCMGICAGVEQLLMLLLLNQQLQ